MMHYELHANDIVFHEGDPGLNFYIIISGYLELSVHGRRIKQLKRGHTLGELALINNAPRAATAKAIGKTQLWALDR